jgi:hypothetical protein
MEGLKKRSIIVVGVMLAAGMFIMLGSKKEEDKKTEQWMIDNSPRTVGNFVMRGGRESADYSYKMDERTYGELDPFGIVARIYENPETGEEYDVVIIASESKDSFHDPRICFTAQGWSINDQWSASVETKTRGTAYMTVTNMDGPEHNKLAAFLYRGQGQFYKTPGDLKWGMFRETVLFGDDLDGVFYRFIPLHNYKDRELTEKQLKQFIADYLDEANKVSNGYF